MSRGGHLRRRALPVAVAAAAAAAAAALLPAPALAHATLIEREDLPLPEWLFIYGALVIIVVSIAIIKGMEKMFNTDTEKNWKAQLTGFLLLGAFSGVVISMAVYEYEISKLVQGGVGGVLAALAIAFMIPRHLVPKPKEA